MILKKILIPIMKVIGIIIYYNRITKVRSRQRVEPAAVQPIVMATGHWPASQEEKKWKNLKKSIFFDVVRF